MTSDPKCEERQADLLDVLYGEASAEVRERVEGHLEGCPACRNELAALEAVRRDLRQWQLPESLAPRPAPPVRQLSARFWPLAAAAALLLALGGAVGLSGVSFRYESGPFVVQLGRPGDSSALIERLEAQETRHRAELAELRRAFATRPAAAASRAGDEVLLERVARMIDESESRQGTRLEAAWSELSQQAEAQRRYDMARISAGLSYLDTKSGAQAARTNELMGYLIEASDRR